MCKTTLVELKATLPGQPDVDTPDKITIQEIGWFDLVRNLKPGISPELIGPHFYQKLQN
jgi:hypothetical protein